MEKRRGRSIRSDLYYKRLSEGAGEESYKPNHYEHLDAGMGAVAIHQDFMPMDSPNEVWNPETEGLRSELDQRIIGQEAAIDSLIAAYDRALVRPEYDKRPIANLAFLGPTGVGKSETAKVLADYLSDGDRHGLIKIDCSNFAYGHQVASLIGSPTGYLGYGNEQIFSPIKVEHAKVILFDEIEKAHPALHKHMLQIMGDGELRINDAHNTVVSFKDTVVIMTSNLGAKEMANEVGGKSLGFGESTRVKTKENLENIATKSFKDAFAPEFIGRLDKMVTFHSLDKTNMLKVLDTKLDTANEFYKKNYGAHISLSDHAKNYLVEIAMKHLDLGARELIRAVETEIQAPFGRYIGAGHVPEGTRVAVFHKDDDLPEEFKKNNSTLMFSQKYDPLLQKWRPRPVSQELAPLFKNDVDDMSEEEPDFEI